MMMRDHTTMDDRAFGIRHLSMMVPVVCILAFAFAAAAVGLPLGDAAAAPQAVFETRDSGVTPPKVVSEVKPQYTPEAMRARIEGRVMMSAVVGTDGTPADIAITQSLDTEYGLDKSAQDALSQWRFTPGRKDDKAVPVRVTVQMTFTLRK